MTLPLSLSVPERRTTPPRPGFHPVEWLCEFLGTAIVLLVGISAICFDLGYTSPIHTLPVSAKLLLTGLVFAGTGSVLAVSPLGRRSGAHLNPVVTLAFWTQRKVHWHDLVGYITAQTLGAVAGTVAADALWRVQAARVADGATRPGPGVTSAEAVALEAGMTACVLLTILFMTSHHRTARLTPVALWLLIAALVWQLAPLTGTSMNPARSLGPALTAGALDVYWIYLAGPLLGTVVAVGVFTFARRTDVLTTKLFHDVEYPSTMGATLPVAVPSPSTGR